MNDVEEIIDAREKIVAYLRKELVGPRGGETEILNEPATQRYTAGTLFPQTAASERMTEAEEDDQPGVAGEDGKSRFEENTGDDPVVLAGQFLPASMGISFFVTVDPALTIEVSGAWYHTEYHTERKKKAYRREPLSNLTGGNAPVFAPGKNGKTDRPIILFDGKARLDIVWRKGKNGWLVTVSLINQAVGEEGQPDPESCLHQMKILCRPAGKGRFTTYPHSRLLTDDQEEHILDLLYRHQASYGIGHGCSVSWSKPEDGYVGEIYSEYMPATEVSPITYELERGQTGVLSLHYLAHGEDHRQELLDELGNFVNGYEAWIRGLPEKENDIPDDLAGERDLLLTRLENALRRMKAGVSLLENNDDIFRSFCMANRAMLMQYIHTGDEYAGSLHSPDGRIYREADLDLYRERKWRPFQLGFQLLTLASVAFPEDPDRDVADLIWFPTGGGKTEAYLSVAAFLIFYRRMRYGQYGGGTTVLMRYTLRLLTTQQFQRASTLLCACELIRREREDLLGKESISIGLWVGATTTPNSYQDASDKFEALLNDPDPLNPFQIDRCPWCGTEIIPLRRGADKNHYGIRASNASFRLFCTLPDCPFHEELPVAVVDDQIYDSPPTFLLATIDKFARMAWVDKSRSLFGSGRTRSPELIIQDELHLITGPLGTIAGHYEMAIDALASWNGVPPKILASTATIRQAGEQVRGLFDRRLELFPPSGLDARNSYFAREDPKLPGRLYLGMMGQGHTGSTSMIRTAAALLQAPVDLGLTGAALDAYWTMIAYHNSLREVGKTLTFAADDIPARVKVIAVDENTRRVMEGTVEELTSNKSAGQLLRLLDRLKKRYDENDAIGMLICSNMFSVGVDVKRLGLMLVNGQPKSTSEYIQSTSRIGRNFPGLVVTLLSATKPRDRSHYERFCGFHQALYRYVEPGSVTPFSPPARERVLHAALVMGVRHGIGLNANESAIQFSSTLDRLAWLQEFFRQRVEHIDPEEAEATMQALQKLIDEWEYLVASHETLRYVSTHPSLPRLMRTAGQTRSPGWDTLQSMRNIDASSIIKIITRQP